MVKAIRSKGARTRPAGTVRFLTAAEPHMCLDEVNGLVAKAIAVRILHPHMQEADKKQMRIHRQLSRVVRWMQLFLSFGTFINQAEFRLDTGAVR
jgi:hypothetical protein